MPRCKLGYLIIALIAPGACCARAHGAGEREDGFESLFNGKDLSGWVVPEGDGGHWRVVDGVIDYDAGSESKGDKNLWSQRELGNFILKIDWRLKQTSGLFDVPIVLHDGTYLKDATGKPITIKRPNADSGIFLRGTGRSQINIWCWPIGSGRGLRISASGRHAAGDPRRRYAAYQRRSPGGRVEHFYYYHDRGSTHRAA